MKKLQLFLFGIILSSVAFSQEKDPVILTVDGEDIYASEFMYIYSKNNDNPSFERDSLADYMELFINYKLKIREALEQKYDTIPRLKKELAQYRKQLSLPYMTDKEKNEKLIEEAYNRTVNEVRASHIMVRLNPNASPADTNAAYVRAMQLRTRIINGEDFEEVARSKGGSDDPSAQSNGGDLGYFTALQMVYPFEEAAFKTPVGGISMPVRTRFGYHIIKVTDKRVARGMIETAHILVLADAKASKEDHMKAEKKINEIYDLLESGEPFEDMALKYSDDQSSKAKGGLLPIFGSGAKQRMVPEFEDAAFSISEDGGYSKPVKTVYGYHIIKRIQAIPTPSYEQMYRELKLRVERDTRAESTRAEFIEDLKKEYSYSDNAPLLLPMFYNAMNDSIFLGKWTGLEDRHHQQDLLFSFADKFYTVNDFENYIISHQTKMRRADKKLYVETLFKKMVSEKVTEYEDSQLEKKYPDFKALMQEYSDGILIFEIMQNEIWKKAARDTTGVKNYYEAHKTDFTYPLRYRGDFYTIKDKATAKAVYKLIKGNKLTAKEIADSLNLDSELNVNVKSQTFNAHSTDAFKVKGKKGKMTQKVFASGLNKAYKNGNSYHVFKVDEVLNPRGREFHEAKGLVTAAYQNELEQQWIKELRKKYEYKVNEDVLFGLGNQ